MNCRFQLFTAQSLTRLGVVGEKSTSTATGGAFGCAPACSVQQAAARRPAFMSSVGEYS